MTSEIETLWRAWDAGCSHYTRDLFVKLGFSELLSPPAKSAAHLPFVSSPTVLCSSVLVYLLVVCVSLIVSSLQKAEVKRDNVLIRSFVQLHNVFLVALSLYMFCGIVQQAIVNKYNFWGNDFRETETEMARMIYIFYLSKIYEFLDTFIMIIKGNMRQVSFLHVYHHVSISMIWWGITYVAPGGDAYYSAALNSLVHVVMYCYYFLASLLGKDEKARKKYLWWGKYLTMFQMTQFVTMLMQATYCLATKKYNQFLARLLVVYMLSLLALFGQFYAQKYSQGASKKRANGSNGAAGASNGSTTNGNGNRLDGTRSNGSNGSNGRRKAKAV